MLKVTTSWDDGDVLDERLAALLERYGIKGTFYISREYRPERLTDNAIRTLTLRHEVGAHTLTHPNLTTVSSTQKHEEIAGSKKWLEEVLGKEVKSFCYPAGHFDAESKNIAREAGFALARTTKLGFITEGNDPYEMPTTLAVYPMPFRKLDKKKYYWGKLLQPFFERSPALHTLGVPLWIFTSFESTAKAAFDAALQKGGVFHMWGHSWEIERYDLWDELEEVLKYIANRRECMYVTNGELIEL